MKDAFLRLVVPAGPTLLLLLSISSCHRLPADGEPRLRVRARLCDIEWVIVDGHDAGDGTPWVAKLTPEKDARLIRELMTGINGAKWKGATKTDGLGFIVLKHKNDSVEAFNFVELAPEIEIRPGFWSKTLARPLGKINQDRVGWKRDDALPQVKVKEIHVWQYESMVTVLREDSPSFAPLFQAASQILKAFDPRLCEQDSDEGDPRRIARYQGAPQFILFLEKPLDMYKLIVWWKKGGGVVSRIRYETFFSSVIAIYTARFHLGVAGVYVAFLPDRDKDVAVLPGRDKTNWYEWNLIPALPALKAMGKPDPHEAFDKLLATYEQLATPER